MTLWCMIIAPRGAVHIVMSTQNCIESALWCAIGTGRGVVAPVAAAAAAASSRGALAAQADALKALRQQVSSRAHHGVQAFSSYVSFSTRTFEGSPDRLVQIPDP